MIIENLSAFPVGAVFPRGVEGLDGLPDLVVLPHGKVDLRIWAEAHGIAADRLPAILDALRSRADIKAAVDLGRLTVPGLSRPLTEEEQAAAAKKEQAAKDAAAAQAKADAEHAALLAELTALRAEKAAREARA